MNELKTAFFRGYPIQGIKILGTHHGTHAEELANVALCHMGYAEEKFPGVKNASIQLISNTEIRKIKDMLEESLGERMTQMDLFFYMMKEHGWLVFGVGGGRFDEHGKEIEGSSLMLFAKHLGVENLPELKHVLTYFNWEDSHGNISNYVKECPDLPKNVISSAGGMIFPEIVKAVWRNLAEDELGTMFMSLVRMIELRIEDDSHFPKALKEVKRNIDYIFLPKRPKVKVMVNKNDGSGEKEEKTYHAELAVVRSDNPRALGAAWMVSQRRKAKTVAVLQIHPNGQFQLFANQNYDERIGGAVRMLRMRECEAKKQRAPKWPDMENESLPESYLHYQKDAERLFNGSLTQKDVPALIADGLLSEETVIEAVTIGLQRFYFDKKHEETCGKRNGTCPVKASGGKIKCPLYQAGLLQCYHAQKRTEMPNKG
jgi:hypothetical protein